MRKLLRLLLALLAMLICAATVLPFIRTDEWWIRVFDFPRTQIFIIGLFVLVSYFLFFTLARLRDNVLIFCLVAAVVAQALQIYPYTPLAAHQVKKAVHGQSEYTIVILVANVLQTNRTAAALQEMITHYQPELVLLTETDGWWIEQMRPLEKIYPFTCLYPLTNTYGMSLYSRLKLAASKVRFLTDPGIPSIYTGVRLRDGRLIHFYGIHPRPPARQQPRGDERQDSAQRDAELVIIGREAAARAEPVIVAGDFNDVAWSHTTRIFQRISRLLDPRVGRGFYNTYHAELPFLRFPLDHLFHSDDFMFIAMERLPYFGSDHFPLVVALHLTPAAAMKQEAPKPKPSDRKEAQETIREYEEEKIRNNNR